MIGGVDISGSGGKAEKFEVKFNITPADATLVVKNVKDKVIQPKERNNLRINCRNI